MTRNQPTTFPLGQVVITANAAEQLDTQIVSNALCRHAAGDWGELPREDAVANERAPRMAAGCFPPTAAIVAACGSLPKATARQRRFCCRTTTETKLRTLGSTHRPVPLE
jgi:hypothetical protein